MIGNGLKIKAVNNARTKIGSISMWYAIPEHTPPITLSIFGLYNFGFIWWTL